MRLLQLSFAIFVLALTGCGGPSAAPTTTPTTTPTTGTETTSRPTATPAEPTPTNVPPTAAPPTPGATRTPRAHQTFPPLGAAFESPLHGYGVALPEGWEATPGTDLWLAPESQGHGSPVLDELMGAGDFGAARMVGASRPVKKGTTLQEWAELASPGTCTSNAMLGRNLVIDDQPALATLNGCASLATLGGAIWDVVVVAGGRGYDFTFDGHLGPSEIAALMATIKLDPDSAVVPPQP